MITIPAAMSTMAWVISIAAMAVSLIMVAVSRAPHARALALLIGFSTFVPLVSAPSQLVALVLIFSIALVITATARAHAYTTQSLRYPRRVGNFTALAITLMVYMQVLRLIGTEVFVRDWALTIAALCVILMGRRMHLEDIPVFARTLVPFVCFHLAYAAGELFALIPPIWPMGDGSTTLASRPNFLFSFLPGRPMTSFAHPIPLAAFAVFAAILFLYCGLHKMGKSYWAMTIAATLIVLLTGTRSAVIALAAGAWILLLTERRVGGALKANLVAAAGVVGLATLTIPATLNIIGLGGSFENSASYEYRTSVLRSAGNLFHQSLVHVLFGWGGNRAAVADHGILANTQYGVLFFDNQLIGMLALYGVVGAAIFVAAIMYTIIRGRPFVRALMVYMAMMVFTYDFLQYLTSTLCFVLVVSFAGLTMTDSEDAFASPTRSHRYAKTRRRHGQRNVKLLEEKLLLRLTDDL